jgi:LacI family transcriptional regulator
MKNVAELAGVSISSVSHYVNNTRQVSEKTTIRIKNAIDTLNFVPNYAAQTLKSGKSKMIGFVVANLENPFYVRIAKGIETITNKYGYELVLLDSAEMKAKECKSIRSLYSRGIEGIIFVPISPDCKYLSDILPENFPLVFLDRQSDRSGNMVLLDNEKAAYQATKYFIHMGITEIAFIALSYGINGNDQTMEERVQGYKKALEENNLPVNDQYIKCLPGGEQLPLGTMIYSETYQSMKNLLETPVKAVVCGNSLAAIGVYSCLKEMKIDIPKDISLISFDNDLWLNLVTPAISSIVQPSEEMGMAAARLLFNKIENPDSKNETIRLKAEIILRESC